MRNFSIIFFIIILSIFMMLSGCSSNKNEPHFNNEKEYSMESIFKDYGDKACFLLYDLENDLLIYHNNDRTKTPFIPASTFKIPNSLISLSEGVIAVDDTIKWDGQERAYEAWNKDLTMKEALPISAVWFYQELARRVGNEKMEDWLDMLDYGNKKTGPQIDTFWLNGDIRITPRQQIDFLRRMLSGKLPVEQNIINSVSDILLIEESENYKLYAKTGWAARMEPQIGWYVGWVTTSDKKFIFATNIENINDSFHNDRKNLTIKALMECNAIPRDERYQ